MEGLKVITKREVPSRVILTQPLRPPSFCILSLLFSFFLSPSFLPFPCIQKSLLKSGHSQGAVTMARKRTEVLFLFRPSLSFLILPSCKHHLLTMEKIHTHTHSLILCQSRPPENCCQVATATKRLQNFWHEAESMTEAK